MKLHPRTARGLGLVEIMIVVVVLGIIAAVAAPSFTDMLNRRRVQAVATMVSTDLAYLRSQQMLTGIEVGLYTNQAPQDATRGTMSCYRVVVQGTAPCYKCWNDDACLGGTSELKTSRVPGSDKVSFMAGGTWASPAGSSRGSFKYELPRLVPNPADFHIDVCGRPEADPRAVLRVEFNTAGRASLCSPNGSMSGYGACNSAAPLLCQ